MLLTLIVLTVGFLAMPNVWPMVYITTAGLLAIPVLWEKMHDYQKNRILAFVDCSVAPSKLCWHTQQSVYAVGSGKIWGKGFLGGTQNQFNFVPEHWTDFPYSVWAEEWGFAGSVFAARDLRLLAAVDHQRRAVGARSRRRGHLRRRRRDDVLARRSSTSRWCSASRRSSA